MSGKLGNAPLVPNAFGLSAERVRALANPLVEIVEYHKQMAETATMAANRAGMAAGRGLHVQADKHTRWAKHLAELADVAVEPKPAPAPFARKPFRVMKGGK